MGNTCPSPGALAREWPPFSLSVLHSPSRQLHTDQGRSCQEKYFTRLWDGPLEFAELLNPYNMSWDTREASPLSYFPKGKARETHPGCGVCCSVTTYICISHYMHSKRLNFRKHCASAFGSYRSVIQRGLQWHS